MSLINDPAPIQNEMSTDKRFAQPVWVKWFDYIRRNLNVAPTYLVADLPTNLDAGSLAFVPNEAGGTVLAFFDGTSWRRCTDRAIVT